MPGWDSAVEIWTDASVRPSYPRAGIAAVFNGALPHVPGAALPFHLRREPMLLHGGSLEGEGRAAFSGLCRNLGDVSSAEMSALLAGAALTADLSRPLRFMTDSLDAVRVLEAVLAGRPLGQEIRYLEPLGQHLVTLLGNTPWQVCKVRAHSNTLMNDMADEIAGSRLREDARLQDHGRHPAPARHTV